MKPIIKRVPRPLLFIVLFFSCVFIYSFFYSMISYRSEYNFTISKIETNIKGTAVLYDSGGIRQSLGVYNIYSEGAGLKIGDSVHKGACKPFLYVYRKGQDGKSDVVYKEQSTFIIPRELFCSCDSE